MGLELHKEEIRRLYIDQRNGTKEIVQYLHDKHNLDIKQGALRMRLKKWGFGKNITRPQAFALIRAASGSEEFQQSVRITPARAADLERYLHRNKILVPDKRGVPAVLAPHAFRLHEKILFESCGWITGSFESERWVSTGSELIITSSAAQTAEKTTLHHFLGHLEMANAFTIRGDYGAARRNWGLAFDSLVELSAGQYHDSLPNILQQINDLKSQGHAVVASQLQQHLVSLASMNQVRSPFRDVLSALKLVHLDDMPDVEEKVMQSYADLFHRFLGRLHYNSFVMAMNLARRQLQRCPQSRLEDHIPSLALYESHFGPGDTRCLDIIRLRTETMYRRQQYADTECEALLLISRASQKHNDVWQRLYFSIKGYYYLALSQKFQSKRELSAMTIHQALQLMEEFSVYDEHAIFKAEHTILEAALQDIGNLFDFL